MTEAEAIKAIMAGYDMLINQAAILAKLPLEDWRDAFEKFETTGPILDPTLYREVMYSNKCKIIRKMIEAAIPLKAAFKEAQTIALNEIALTGKLT